MRKGDIMSKDKMVVSMATMVLFAASIAIMSNKNWILVFAISWIMGVVSTLLIQYLWYKRPVPKIVLAILTVVIPAITCTCIYYWLVV